MFLSFISLPFCCISSANIIHKIHTTSNKIKMFKNIIIWTRLYTDMIVYQQNYQLKILSFIHDLRFRC